ncbi:MAG: hypothetical protein AB1656_03380 [Candidatus Omnitrophota bacterium]
MTLSRSSKIYGIAAIAALLLIGGVFCWPALQSANIKALFDGPVELCPREAPVYYPRGTYQFDKYLSSHDSMGMDANSSAAKFATKSNQQEISYVDGGARDEVEAAMRKHAQSNHDANDENNPALSRLRSPSVYKDREPYHSLQITAPEDGSLFPPNLCAPFVEWEDPRNDFWEASIRLPGEEKPLLFQTDKKRWRIPSAVWERLRREAVEQDAVIQIKGVQRDKSDRRIGSIQASPEAHIRISKDAADNFIVYRLVAPPFSSFKTPDLYLRDIRQDEPRIFLSSRRQYCLNCHTFSSKQGNSGKLALQVRSLVASGQKLPVYLAIFDIDKKIGFKSQLPFEIQMTTFMAWSPDGEKLAYSANQRVAALKPIVFETQLAGMATSDIAIYDLQKNDTYLLPGASDPNLLEIYPQWTPDGKRLIFSRSPVGNHPAHILYDLYILDLEGENPTPQPIAGASNNGRSNYFPHFSPDGKWFSFDQCDGGDLIRSSSDIYLLPADLQGEAHRLEFNTPYAADSWHSWSSNSRWLVFASKREGGVYAYLYMSHIDENGHASPAIPLPLIDKPQSSFNIPEFAANEPDIQENELFESIRVEPQPRLVQLRHLDQS